jgi:hypothetical protein
MLEHTDVTIDGQRYRIGRFSARTGSWILFQLLNKALPALVGSQLEFGGKLGGGVQMSEADFLNLQDHCLMVCGRYRESGVAEPIMKSPGVFALKDVEYDILACMGLTVHALAHNFSDFFAGNGSKLGELMKAMPGFGSSPPSA